jgi:hypothetical protein
VSTASDDAGCPTCGALPDHHVIGRCSLVIAAYKAQVAERADLADGLEALYAEVGIEFAPPAITDAVAALRGGPT